MPIHASVQAAEADSRHEAYRMAPKHPTLNLCASPRFARAKSVEKILGNDTAKFTEPLADSEGDQQLDDISYPGASM